MDFGGFGHRKPSSNIPQYPMRDDGDISLGDIDFYEQFNRNAGRTVSSFMPEETEEVKRSTTSSFRSSTRYENRATTWDAHEEQLGSYVREGLRDYLPEDVQVTRISAPKGFPAYEHSDINQTALNTSSTSRRVDKYEFSRDVLAGNLSGQSSSRSSGRNYPKIPPKPTNPKSNDGDYESHSVTSNTSGGIDRDFDMHTYANVGRSVQQPAGEVPQGYYPDPTSSPILYAPDGTMFSLPMNGEFNPGLIANAIGGDRESMTSHSEQNSFAIMQNDSINLSHGDYNPPMSVFSDEINIDSQTPKSKKKGERRTRKKTKSTDSDTAVGSEDVTISSQVEVNRHSTRDNLDLSRGSNTNRSLPPVPRQSGQNYMNYARSDPDSHGVYEDIPEANMVISSPSYSARQDNFGRQLDSSRTSDREYGQPGMHAHDQDIHSISMRSGYSAQGSPGSSGKRRSIRRSRSKQGSDSSYGGDKMEVDLYDDRYASSKRPSLPPPPPPSSRSLYYPPMEELSYPNASSTSSPQLTLVHVQETDIDSPIPLTTELLSSLPQGNTVDLDYSVPAAASDSSPKKVRKSSHRKVEHSSTPSTDGSSLPKKPKVAKKPKLLIATDNNDATENIDALPTEQVQSYQHLETNIDEVIPDYQGQITTELTSPVEKKTRRVKKKSRSRERSDDLSVSQEIWIDGMPDTAEQNPMDDPDVFPPSFAEDDGMTTSTPVPPHRTKKKKAMKVVDIDIDQESYYEPVMYVNIGPKGIAAMHTPEAIRAFHGGAEVVNDELGPAEDSEAHIEVKSRLKKKKKLTKASGELLDGTSEFDGYVVEGVETNIDEIHVAATDSATKKKAVKKKKTKSTGDLTGGMGEIVDVNIDSPMESQSKPKKKTKKKITKSVGDLSQALPSEFGYTVDDDACGDFGDVQTLERPKKKVKKSRKLTKSTGDLTNDGWTGATLFDIDIDGSHPRETSIDDVLQMDNMAGDASDQAEQKQKKKKKKITKSVGDLTESIEFPNESSLKPKKKKVKKFAKSMDNLSTQDQSLLVDIDIDNNPPYPSGTSEEKPKKKKKKKSAIDDDLLMDSSIQEQLPKSLETCLDDIPGGEIQFASPSEIANNLKVQSFETNIDDILTPPIMNSQHFETDIDAAFQSRLPHDGYLMTETNVDDILTPIQNAHPIRYMFDVEQSPVVSQQPVDPEYMNLSNISSPEYQNQIMEQFDDDMDMPSYMRRETSVDDIFDSPNLTGQSEEAPRRKKKRSKSVERSVLLTGDDVPTEEQKVKKKRSKSADRSEILTGNFEEQTTGGTVKKKKKLNKSMGDISVVDLVLVDIDIDSPMKIEDVEETSSLRKTKKKKSTKSVDNINEAGLETPSAEIKKKKKKQKSVTDLSLGMIDDQNIDIGMVSPEQMEVVTSPESTIKRKKKSKKSTDIPVESFPETLIDIAPTQVQIIQDEDVFMEQQRDQRLLGQDASNQDILLTQLIAPDIIQFEGQPIDLQIHTMKDSNDDSSMFARTPETSSMKKKKTTKKRPKTKSVDDLSGGMEMSLATSSQYDDAFIQDLSKSQFEGQPIDLQIHTMQDSNDDSSMFARTPETSSMKKNKTTKKRLKTKSVSDLSGGMEISLTTSAQYDDAFTQDLSQNYDNLEGGFDSQKRIKKTKKSTRMNKSVGDLSEEQGGVFGISGDIDIDQISRSQEDMLNDNTDQGKKKKKVVKKKKSTSTDIDDMRPQESQSIISQHINSEIGDLIMGEPLSYRTPVRLFPESRTLSDRILPMETSVDDLYLDQNTMSNVVDDLLVQQSIHGEIPQIETNIHDVITDSLTINVPVERHSDKHQDGLDNLAVVTDQEPVKKKGMKKKKINKSLTDLNENKADFVTEIDFEQYTPDIGEASTLGRENKPKTIKKKKMNKSVGDLSEQYLASMDITPIDISNDGGLSMAASQGELSDVFSSTRSDTVRKSGRKKKSVEDEQLQAIDFDDPTRKSIRKKKKKESDQSNDINFQEMELDPSLENREDPVRKSTKKKKKKEGDKSIGSIDIQDIELDPSMQNRDDAVRKSGKKKKRKETEQNQETQGIDIEIDPLLQNHDNQLPEDTVIQDINIQPHLDLKTDTLITVEAHGHGIDLPTLTRDEPVRKSSKKKKPKGNDQEFFVVEEADINPLLQLREDAIDQTIEEDKETDNAIVLELDPSLQNREDSIRKSTKKKKKIDCDKSIGSIDIQDRELDPSLQNRDDAVRKSGKKKKKKDIEQQQEDIVMQDIDIGGSVIPRDDPIRKSIKKKQVNDEQEILVIETQELDQSLQNRDEPIRKSTKKKKRKESDKSLESMDVENTENDPVLIIDRDDKIRKSGRKKKPKTPEVADNIERFSQEIITIDDEPRTPMSIYRDEPIFNTLKETKSNEIENIVSETTREEVRPWTEPLVELDTNVIAQNQEHMEIVVVDKTETKVVEIAEQNNNEITNQNIASIEFPMIDDEPPVSVEPPVIEQKEIVTRPKTYDIKPRASALKPSVSEKLSREQAVVSPIPVLPNVITTSKVDSLKLPELPKRKPYIPPQPSVTRVARHKEYAPVKYKPWTDLLFSPTSGKPKQTETVSADVSFSDSSVEEKLNTSSTSVDVLHKTDKVQDVVLTKKMPQMITIDRSVKEKIIVRDDKSDKVILPKSPTVAPLSTKTITREVTQTTPITVTTTVISLAHESIITAQANGGGYSSLDRKPSLRKPAKSLDNLIDADDSEIANYSLPVYNRYAEDEEEERKRERARTKSVDNLTLLQQRKRIAIAQETLSKREQSKSTGCLLEGRLAKMGRRTLTQEFTFETTKTEEEVIIIKRPTPKSTPEKSKLTQLPLNTQESKDRRYMGSFVIVDIYDDSSKKMNKSTLEDSSDEEEEAFLCVSIDTKSDEEKDSESGKSSQKDDHVVQTKTVTATETQVTEITTNLVTIGSAVERKPEIVIAKVHDFPATTVTPSAVVVQAREILVDVKPIRMESVGVSVVSEVKPVIKMESPIIISAANYIAKTHTKNTQVNLGSHFGIIQERSRDEGIQVSQDDFDVQDLIVEEQSETEVFDSSEDNSSGTETDGESGESYTAADENYTQQQHITEQRDVIDTVLDDINEESSEADTTDDINESRHTTTITITNEITTIESSSAEAGVKIGLTDELKQTEDHKYITTAQLSSTLKEMQQVQEHTGNMTIKKLSVDHQTTQVNGRSDLDHKSNEQVFIEQEEIESSVVYSDSDSNEEAEEIMADEGGFSETWEEIVTYEYEFDKETGTKRIILKPNIMDVNKKEIFRSFDKSEPTVPRTPRLEKYNLPGVDPESLIVYEYGEMISMYSDTANDDIYLNNSSELSSAGAEGACAGVERAIEIMVSQGLNDATGQLTQKQNEYPVIPEGNLITTDLDEDEDDFINQEPLPHDQHRDSPSISRDASQTVQPTIGGRKSGQSLIDVEIDIKHMTPNLKRAVEMLRSKYSIVKLSRGSTPVPVEIAEQLPEGYILNNDSLPESTNLHVDEDLMDEMQDEFESVMKELNKMDFSNQPGQDSSTPTIERCDSTTSETETLVATTSELDHADTFDFQDDDDDDTSGEQMIFGMDDVFVKVITTKDGHIKKIKILEGKEGGDTKKIIKPEQVLPPINPAFRQFGPTESDSTADANYFTKKLYKEAFFDQDDFLSDSDLEASTDRRDHQFRTPTSSPTELVDEIDIVQRSQQTYLDERAQTYIRQITEALASRGSPDYTRNIYDDNSTDSETSEEEYYDDERQSPMRSLSPIAEEASTGASTPVLPLPIRRGNISDSSDTEDENEIEIAVSKVDAQRTSDVTSEEAPQAEQHQSDSETQLLKEIIHDDEASKIEEQNIQDEQRQSYSETELLKELIHDDEASKIEDEPNLINDDAEFSQTSVESTQSSTNSDTAAETTDVTPKTADVTPKTADVRPKTLPKEGAAERERSRNGSSVDPEFDIATQKLTLEGFLSSLDDQASQSSL